jgi:hypothetical protein
VVALATVCVACSLTTSLDGFSGGVERLADGDATADGFAPIPDASLDADADANVDGGSFCASAPAGAFCEDFENGLGAWLPSTTDTNTFAIDTAASTSPTHSALSTAYPSTNVTPSACVRRSFGGNFQSITVEADVRFEGTSTLDYDILGLLGSSDRNLSIQVQNGLLEFDEDTMSDSGLGDQVTTSTGFSVDSKWHHYRWTNELAAGRATVEVFVDGTKVGGVTADARAFAAPLTLEVGDCVIYPTQTPWKVRFDNVLLLAK